MSSRSLEFSPFHQNLIRSKEAEGGIAVLQQARLLQRSIARGQLPLFTVFRDHQRIRSKHLTSAGAAQKIQRLGILRLCLIGRIEKDQINRPVQLAQPLQQGADSARLQRKTAIDLQRGKIGTKRRQGGFSIFGKPDVLRSPAERFDADCASTGIEVDKPATIEARRKNIEEGLAEPVAGRPGL